MDPWHHNTPHFFLRPDLFWTFTPFPESKCLFASTSPTSLSPFLTAKYGRPTVDFALALDVLDGSATLALDLAAWHQAEVLPRLMAPPLAAAIVDAFRGTEGCPQAWLKVSTSCVVQCSLGWTVLWYVVSAYFMLASVFIFRITVKSN